MYTMQEGPKCPKCGKPLSYLKRVCTESTEYELSADGCYEKAETSEEKCSGFACPFCGFIIAEDETSAIEFLRKSN
jgi:transcription initiation factor IIE alpha subunit